MKYRMFLVVALLAAFAAFGATSKAKAATPLQTFLGDITCASPGPVLSEEGIEEEDPCEGVTTGNVGLAVPVCINGTTYKYLPDQDADGELNDAADLSAYLMDVFPGTNAHAGACGGAAFVAPPVNIFLCYSVFQTEPGVWPKPQALALLQQGYWLAYAVPGNVPGGTNIGGFHLVCNLAAGQAAGDSFVGGDGTVLGPAYAGDAGLYPKVGP
jgi:hypothetical protein